MYCRLKRLFLSIPVIIILVILLSACRNQGAERNARTVTVSIVPQKYLVDRISGGTFNVQVMIPPGANHETFEPTPRDMATLHGVRLYFSNGLLDFEHTWLPRFTAATPGMRVINTSEGISLLGGHHHAESPAEAHGTGKTEEAAIGLDPHTWLSPAAMKIQAATIARALTEADKDNAALYANNLLLFNNTADSVDQQIRKILAGCPGKSFMIFHPALAYFARDYGLEQISIESEGKEPSAGRIRELIDLGREKHIRSILISKEFDIRHAEAIARELNVRILVINPMEENWPENMIRLARTIADN